MADKARRHEFLAQRELAVAERLERQGDPWEARQYRRAAERHLKLANNHRSVAGVRERQTRRDPAAGVTRTYQQALRTHEGAEQRERDAADRLDERGDREAARQHRRAADRHARFAANYRRALRGLGRSA